MKESERKRGETSPKDITQLVPSAMWRYVILFVFWLPCSSPQYKGELVAPLISNEFPESSPASECALVLQRTYVNRDRFRDPYLYDSDKPRGIGPKEELCIRYSDVNDAVAEAKKKLDYRHPPTIHSMEPYPGDIDITAELVLEVTRILANRFRLSKDEIINGLPLIDTSRTDIWDVCPAHVKPMPCTMERYRAHTAHCNNIKHPSWGVANTPFVRFLPPVYADGISAPRVSVMDGGPLPNARLVSSRIHRDHDHPSGHLSVLVMSWGQFIDHDLTLASPPRDANDLDFDCCGIPPEKQHKNCMPLDIPRDDPFYARHGQTCMDFKRSIAGHRPGCALGPRVHVNLLTGSIDANFIYGSTEDLSSKLRLGRKGLMRTWDRFREYGLKPLLPAQSDNAERDCIARPRRMYCFLAGDERVNEQIHLTVLHTLYVRDHNRLATKLAQLNPHWDDHRIYHETRHILAAALQHITYNEFLPMALGEDLMHKYNLTLQKDGYWNHYDPEVHLGLGNAFQAAAFRFGHTHIQGMVRRYNKYHEFLGQHELHNLLRHPFILYEPGKLDELIGGLINTPAQTYDPFITDQVTNHLFQEPPDHFGMDLAAMNLLRGREHGLPGYNDYREWCGLPRAKTFADLEPYLNNQTAFQYSQIYKHPDDIDLWSAGVSERILPGAMVGPTFACIIARQFSNLKRGDRYWFENSGFPSAFTPEQLREIRKATQAKIICENADDMPTIQLWVMRLPHPVYNPRLHCSDIPDIDLRFWQEDPVHGGYKKK